MTKQPIVFVSAVSAEFKDFREAAALELRRLGVSSIEQADYTGDSASIVQQLQEKIRASDAIFCLIGNVSGEGPTNLMPTRSWTQWEYHWAKQFGKQIFLFFPQTGCAAGVGTDTAQQTEQQRRHRLELQNPDTAPHWFEFRDIGNLCLEVAHAVARLRERLTAPDLERQVARCFPTPMADLFVDCFSKQDANDLRQLLRESLRWMACLSAHDGLVNAAFGSTTCSRLAAALASRTHTSADCRALLHSVCAADGNASRRFVREILDWRQSNADTIDELVRIDGNMNSLKQTKDQRAKRTEEFKTGLARFYSSLEFLERYVVAVVENFSDAKRQITLRLLRGRCDSIRSFTGAADPKNEFSIVRGDTYLLSLEQRQALYLRPAIHYSAVGGEQLFGLCGIKSTGQSPQVTLQRFGEFREVELHHAAGTAWCLTELDERVECDFLGLLATWLGPALSAEILGDSVDPLPVVWRDKFLDDASWSALHKLALPDDQETTLGGQYRIRGRPIHRGRFADLYLPEPLKTLAIDPSVAPSQLVVHVLREDENTRPEIQEWFRRRVGFWEAIADAVRVAANRYAASEPAAVLRIVDHGPTDRAWLLTERVPESHTLQQRVGKSDRPLENRLLRRVLIAAAELCCAAHEKGLRLLTLPLRHFLFDSQERLFFTGFDATVEADPAPWLKAGSVKDYLREIGRDDDWSSIDPELGRELRQIPATADVFALGVLLAKMRVKDERPMKSLTPSSWQDPWECLRFHCLAADPHQRLQTPHQVLEVLQHRCGATRIHNVPPLVRIPDGRAITDRDDSPMVASFEIHSTPTTNVEYLAYCRATNRPEPRYFRADSGLDANEAQRMAAPWLPVCCVNRSDVLEYCRWLGSHDEARGVWRLPTEREWLRAAVLDESRLYPWGNDVPNEHCANYHSHYHGPTVVGAFSAGTSPSGCRDLAGNVWEWCDDYSPDESPCRILKGGAFGFGADSLLVTSRYRAVATYRSSHIGFRLVRTDR